MPILFRSLNPQLISHQSNCCALVQHFKRVFQNFRFCDKIAIVCEWEFLKNSSFIFMSKIHDPICAWFNILKKIQKLNWSRSNYTCVFSSFLRKFKLTVTLKTQNWKRMLLFAFCLFKVFDHNFFSLVFICFVLLLFYFLRRMVKI